MAVGCLYCRENLFFFLDQPMIETVIFRKFNMLIPSFTLQGICGFKPCSLLSTITLVTCSTGEEARGPSTTGALFKSTSTKRRLYTNRGEGMGRKPLMTILQTGVSESVSR